MLSSGMMILSRLPPAWLTEAANAKGVLCLGVAWASAIFIARSQWLPRAHSVFHCSARSPPLDIYLARSHRQKVASILQRAAPPCELTHKSHRTAHPPAASSIFATEHEDRLPKQQK